MVAQLESSRQSSKCENIEPAEIIYHDEQQDIEDDQETDDFSMEPSVGLTLENTLKDDKPEETVEATIEEGADHTLGLAECTQEDPLQEQKDEEDRLISRKEAKKARRRQAQADKLLLQAQHKAE